MVYEGGCHCGRIAFEVEGDLNGVMECNCSICAKRGNLLWFVSRGQLRLLTPPENLSTYMFGKKQIRHRFCAHCGCAPFGEGIDPKTGTAVAAVNVRCLDDVDPAMLKITRFDGRSL
jgi:hypothetical protein